MKIVLENAEKNQERSMLNMECEWTSLCPYDLTHNQFYLVELKIELDIRQEERG